MMETLKGLINAQPLSFPDAERTEVQTRRINDGFLVYFVLPVADSQAAVRGYARGIFAISAETATEMRSAVLHSVLIVVSIVFGVSAILYPVILRLTRRWPTTPPICWTPTWKRSPCSAAPSLSVMLIPTRTITACRSTLLD